MRGDSGTAIVETKARLRAIQVSLWIFLAGTFVAIVIHVRAAILIAEYGDDASYLIENLRSLGEQIGYAAIFRPVMFLITTVFFLAWLARSRKNLLALNRGPLKYTFGSFIWSFLIPIFNMIRPYQIVREIEFKSRIPASGQPEERPHTGTPLLRSWWAFMWVAGTLDRAGADWMLHPGISNIVKGCWLSGLSDLFWIISGYCLIRVTGAISRSQSM